MPSQKTMLDNYFLQRIDALLNEVLSIKDIPHSIQEKIVELQGEISRSRNREHPIDLRLNYNLLIELLIRLSILMETLMK